MNNATALPYNSEKSVAVDDLLVPRFDLNLLVLRFALNKQTHPELQEFAGARKGDE